MKKLVTVIVLLLFVKCGWTQNTNLDFRYAIKFYNLVTYEDYSKSKNDTFLYSSWYPDEKLRIFHPTFAFQWKSGKNNFHEVELTDFTLSITGKDLEDDTTGVGQSEDANNLVTTYISARYEYILNFNKLKNTKFVPSLGFGINPYLGLYEYSPGISNEYRTSEKYIGARAFITPRLTYHLSSKVFFDLNIPVCLFDTYFQSFNNEDPELSVEERTTNTFNFDAFPKVFSVRIGVGVKF